MSGPEGPGVIREGCCTSLMGYLWSQIHSTLLQETLRLEDRRGWAFNCRVIRFSVVTHSGRKKWIVSFFLLKTANYLTRLFRKNYRKIY